jgi:hypothetical protein
VLVVLLVWWRRWRQVARVRAGAGPDAAAAPEKAWQGLLAILREVARLTAGA